MARPMFDLRLKANRNQYKTEYDNCKEGKKSKKLVKALRTACNSYNTS